MYQNPYPLINLTLECVIVISGYDQNDCDDCYKNEKNNNDDGGNTDHPQQQTLQHWGITKHAAPRHSKR